MGGGGESGRSFEQVLSNAHALWFYKRNTPFFAAKFMLYRVPAFFSLEYGLSLSQLF